MDDCSWMYQDSPKGLWRMDYCNGVQDYINHALSNPKILVEEVLNVHTRGVKIKSFLI